MKLLSKYEQAAYFEIWTPRYRDKVVLLAKRKVQTHNKIVFTKAKSMGTNPWYVSGATIKKCKLDSNGAIPCYAVPIDLLEPIEYTDRDIRTLI